MEETMERSSSKVVVSCLLRRSADSSAMTSNSFLVGLGVVVGMELGGVDVAVAESTDNEGGSWTDKAFRIIEPRIVVARRLWAAVLDDASFFAWRQTG